ncbi:MAG: hypothetical protein N2487_00715 [Verrucomicrobiae bacterium]|nr:hypothetical protein [Verrucomicrobiae bacterium]
MKLLFVILTIAVLSVAGCGQKDDANKKTEQAGQNPLTAPVDYMGAAAKAKKYSEKTIDIVNLKRAIQEFQAGEGRLPNDLNELVAEKYLNSIPQPPQGMKIVYDPKTGEVKIVPEQ